jgi:hypothetical protein
MRHFQAFAHPEEPEVAPYWAAGVARDGENETHGSDGTGWVYNGYSTGSQEGKPDLVAKG